MNKLIPKGQNAFRQGIRLFRKAASNTRALSKGIQERKRFLNLLQRNPEVIIRDNQELINNWVNNPELLINSEINPEGRVGKYFDYLHDRFGVEPKREISLGSSNNFPEGRGGDFTRSTGLARVNVGYPDKFVDIGVHELGGHSTEDQVLGEPISKYTQVESPEVPSYYGIADFMSTPITETFKRRVPKTVNDVYLGISSISPSIKNWPRFIKNNKRLTMPANSRDSKYSEEARATLKELQELKLNEFGYDLEKYNQWVDNVPEEELVENIYNLSAYGRDYRNRFYYASDSKRKQWINLVRYALKYLPTISIPIIGALTIKQ